MLYREASGSKRNRDSLKRQLSGPINVFTDAMEERKTPDKNRESENKIFEYIEEELPQSPFLPCERSGTNSKLTIPEATNENSGLSDRQMDVESSTKKSIASKKKRGPSPPRRYLMPLLELEQ